LFYFINNIFQDIPFLPLDWFLQVFTG